MKKLKVIQIDNFLYTLEDDNKEIYTINLEFYNTKVSIGDYLFIPIKVLKEKNIYTYGEIIENTDVDEYIKIIHNNEEIYLQRYYG